MAEHNLVERIDTDPATVAITPQGVSCALAGGSVQDHINQPRPGTTYNNYMPNAKGVIIGEQQHFTQNNTDGVDPTLFAQLAGYIGQVSTTLGMSDADRAELERVAQDLHTEATSENPEPGRLRQFATQLKDKLLEAGTTIAATMGAQMADQALAALVQEPLRQCHEPRRIRHGISRACLGVRNAQRRSTLRARRRARVFDCCHLPGRPTTRHAEPGRTSTHHMTELS
ncbi:hypothetical protein ACIHCV_41865 [Streptomyces sp. NPDC051956]|uniref:hypothetical protein n=1 Tax=Streptomyces sp. NPDC051956 TaxID=3365677 RepID=UPI0037D0B6E7